MADRQINQTKLPKDQQENDKELRSGNWGHTLFTHSLLFNEHKNEIENNGTTD